jgi:hypothetical protein
MNRRIFLAIALSVIVSSLAAVLAGGASARPSNDLQAAKSATGRYHSLEQAKEDGYAAFGGVNEPCVASPAGVMGVHLENKALMADPAIDLTRPEILVYLPTSNGSL